MPLDLYSKGAVDTLLAGKLSDAPSDGITYGRKDGAWVTVSNPSNDIATANAIASNIAFLTPGSNYGRWVGNQAPSVADNVTWDINDTGTGSATYSYSSGNDFYYTGTITGTYFNIAVSGGTSSFQVTT